MNITLDLDTIEGYQQFLAVKSLPVYRFTGSLAWFPDEYASRIGIKPPRARVARYEPASFLFDYQRDIASMAIARQKFAIFADCGLGKTLMIFEYVRHVAATLPKSRRILIVSPLMVVRQTISEAKKFYGNDLICPLQLPVIDRLVRLYSNPGEIVFSPFTGIGSEGYCAVKAGRRFYGCELKLEYFDEARRNLARAEKEASLSESNNLFDSLSDSDAEHVGSAA